jgi:hypothetical protein
LSLIWLAYFLKLQRLRAGVLFSTRSRSLFRFITEGLGSIVQWAFQLSAGRAKKNAAAWASIRRSPKRPAEGFHDGAAEPQSHRHALRLSGIECLKEMFHVFCFDAAAQILHRDPHGRTAVESVSLSASFRRQSETSFRRSKATMRKTIERCF